MKYNEAFPLMRPYSDPTNDGFWNAIREHRLVFQKCKWCGLIVYRPRPRCPRCLSTEKEWTESQGKGYVYSHVTVIYEKTGYPGYEVPYSIVIVEMVEGVRFLANMDGIDPLEVRVGMPVEVIFEDIAEDLILPRFRSVEM